MTDREFHACRVAWLKDGDDLARAAIHDALLDGFKPSSDGSRQHYLAKAACYAAGLPKGRVNPALLPNSLMWLEKHK